MLEGFGSIIYHCTYSNIEHYVQFYNFVTLFPSE